MVEARDFWSLLPLATVVSANEKWRQWRHCAYSQVAEKPQGKNVVAGKLVLRSNRWHFPGQAYIKTPGGQPGYRRARNRRSSHSTSTLHTFASDWPFFGPHSTKTGKRT
jgi:hypothetical protein